MNVTRDGKKAAGATQGLTEEFEAVDADGDGRIDCAEFGELIASLGVEMRTAKVDDWFRTIDADSDGLINSQEFVNWRNGN